MEELIIWVQIYGVILVGTLLGFLFVSFLIRYLLLKFFKAKFNHLRFGFFPVLFVSLGAGFFLTRIFFPYGWGSINFLEKFFGITGILSFGRICEILLINLLDRDKLGNKNLGNPAKTLLKVFIKLLVWISMGLLVLDFLGITLTPLLASLGVGSLAVALALQDTLGNLFSGFYILADRPFFIGDWIQTNGDPESLGRVEKIGWRSCELTTLQNNSIVIPNSKISSSMITNFSKPATDLSVTIDCGVSYNSNLETVEKTVLDEMNRLAQEKPQLLPQPEATWVRFEVFADSSINFKVGLIAPDFGQRGLLKSEAIKRIHQRFKQDQIEIPFPQRVVNLQK